ncbi:MAG: polymer-forming cytoskeletal protein [Alphaproteobacteria bacterium]|nr:polymer-forming cytoskeletal protein [Alphaproteobacteria bacterium]
MTVFNRTDKPSDVASAPMSPTAEAASPALTPEARRAQAIAAGARISVLSRSLKITGQIETTEDIQIDGEVDGDVRGVTIKFGAGAKVKGAVYGDEVELAGTIEGKIEAKTVIVTSTGRMIGDILHQDITIQSGAFIDGHIRPEQAKSESRKVIPVHKTASGLRETLEQK